MDRIYVKSGNLKSVGYDPESEDLEVEFLNGGIYLYYDVPAPVHAELMWAESHGRYFREWVRDRYEFVRVS